MRDLIRLFTQIALLRRGPQDVPVSMLLLALTMAAYVGVNLLLRAALVAGGGWPARLLAATLFLLAWYVVLLRLTGRPERTLQTTTAVFGLQTMLAPPLVVSEWLLQRVDADSGWQVPIVAAGVLLLVWVIAANGHIVKAALEWSGVASVTLVIAQVLAGEVLLWALFPPLHT